MIQVGGSATHDGLTAERNPSGALLSQEASSLIVRNSALRDNGFASLIATRCEGMVVEDSVNGVIAAKQAGMQVIGFTGGGHCGSGHAESLRQHGADWIFNDFDAVAAFLMI